MIATWYGKALHGNFMANGERFDMNNPHIAASPVLPFGTKILVWYEGRGLVVVVKDRMPKQTPLNQIDLSLAGARKLGLVSVGRAVVFAKILE